MKSLELAKTVHTLAEAMSTVRARIHNQKWTTQDEAKELENTWRCLEAEILRLLPISDQRFLETKIGSLFGTGSFALLKAVGDLGFNSARFELTKARRKNLLHEGPAYFSALAALGMHHGPENPDDPRNFIIQLMEECRHGTDAQAWRAAVLGWKAFYLEEVLRWVQNQELPLPAGMAAFLHRLIRDQIKRQPTTAVTMINQSASDAVIFNACCAFLAGFTIPDRILRPRPDVPAFQTLATRLGSKHGQLAIRGRLKSLEAYLDPSTRRSPLETMAAS